MKLKDCDNCLVYGSDNKPFTKAKVSLNKDKGTITLFFKNPNMSAMKLRTYVDFYDSQLGLVRSVCDVAIKKNPQANSIEPWIADCTIREIKELVQRQKDLRMEVEISKQFRLDNGKSFGGIIKNISAGGILVVASQPIKRGTIIAFTHRFENTNTICQIKAQILRAKGAAGKGYAYGCQFVDLSMEAEAIIRKFVYIKQLEKEGRTEGIAE